MAHRIPEQNTMRTRLLGLAALAVCLGALAACATRSASSAAACSTYCSSYDEGYQWAQRADLLDEKRCGGYAQAFTEGCLQAVSDGTLSANPRRAY